MISGQVSLEEQSWRHVWSSWRSSSMMLLTSLYLTCRESSMMSSSQKTETPESTIGAADLVVQDDYFCMSMCLRSWHWGHWLPSLRAKITQSGYQNWNNREMII